MIEQERPSSGRVVMGAVALPLLMLLLSGAVLALWWGQLPDPVASHWDAAGRPDGFSSPAAVASLLMGLGVVALIAAAWAGTASTSTAARSLAALASGTGGFLLTSLLGTLAPQLGVGDVSTVMLPLPAFVVGLVIGVACGYATSLLIPRWASPLPQGVDGVRPAELGPTEVAVWSRVALTATPGIVIAASATALTLLFALVLGSAWMLVVPLALGLLMVAALSVRVTVGPQGLRVAGPLGWPRAVVGIDDVAAVAAAEVRAMAEFGGWGYRVAVRGPLQGAKGFVLRSGRAIVVIRRSGGVELVVVDDAGTGAALLEGYRQRAAQLR
ncbi:DUF1648 domain-containing protein [Micropruina sonneratiae]|uniref:DUF1648 domain-containing protein n=1 Tax=Micropruina sonneratiae TaxID=2986940 RepID=UPI0022267EE2|nr:DUF1648 domain-containing protein [Micropruina sp. KQZ13P-5]MCW3157814.1 DUF1648 domain-containing protein [Micropruina sp. KQZ13P-5]